MIPKIDRLVLKDVLGPWMFGVGLFAGLLMAATYLGRIAGFIVDGVPPLLVLELTGLLLPTILTKTFTMSMLLATLLGFGRLSADSELVALRASGASVYRIIFAAAMLSLLIAVSTFIFNETFVPVATTRYKSLTTELAGSLKVKAAQPTAIKYVEKEKLKAWITCRNIDPSTKEMSTVAIVSYDEKGERSFMLFADYLDFKIDSKTLLFDPSGAMNAAMYHWKARGHVKLVSADFSNVTNITNDMWPSEIPNLKENFAQLTEPKDADFDSMTMVGLRDFILFHRAQGDMIPKDLHNYEYGYWSKIAIPLGAVMFGVLGAVLGIRSHRSGTASGYGIAIGITFMFVLLGNVMNVWAQGGVIPAWSAAFTPILLGSIASGIIMWRRNI